MAIQLEANYSKKLGLPGYSSHQYSVTVHTELSDLGQVARESTRLYALLQSSVDQEIQKTGFLPGAAAHPNGHHKVNGNANGNGHPAADIWNCSEKQRDLIQKIVAENHLEKAGVEWLAQARFGKSVRALDKLEASGLIDELLEQCGKAPVPRGRVSRPVERTGYR